MSKRQRPSAWEIAKFASKNRTPFSKGGMGWGHKKSKVVPGFTRTAGPFKRAFLADPRRALTMGAPPEKKYWDLGFGVNPTNAGQIDGPLIGIAQGTTEQQRIGGKINLVNFNIHGQVIGVQQVGAAVLPDVTRFMVVLDKQANGALPVVTDILKTAQINKFMNLDNVDRFQILKEKWITNDVLAWVATPFESIGQIKNFKINLKMNIPIHFSSTLGAITEFKSNNIICLYINSNGQSVVNYTSRAKFTDA